MKLEEIKNLLDAELLTASQDLKMEIVSACGSDLMSDVLSFIKVGSLLLTGLINSQVVYTAEIAEIKAVCFVRGKVPSRETIELAENKNIALLSTKLPMFESCGTLHKNGLKGCSEI